MRDGNIVEAPAVKIPANPMADVWLHFGFKKDEDSKDLDKGCMEHVQNGGEILLKYTIKYHKNKTI